MLQAQTRVRLLPLPTEAAACKSLVGMVPMLVDGAKFEQQAGYFEHLEQDERGKESGVTLLPVCAVDELLRRAPTQV